MAFLDTQPALIDRFDAAGPWSRFRVQDPRKQLAMLREICRSDRPITLGAPGGTSTIVNLWSVDDTNGRLSFKVDRDAQLIAAEVAATPDLWAAAYCQDAKIQFALPRVALQSQGEHRVLLADIPRLMYLLPRRRAVRVRRDSEDAPTLRFRHPLAPEIISSLKLLDISVSGCALARPAGSLPLLPGVLLHRVELQLDEETVLFADLCVRHVTVLAEVDASIRVGCEWCQMPASALDRLQTWIQRGRRRRELISLSFD